jgi:hypothetical protein
MPPQAYSDWTKLAEDGLHTWAEASSDWADGMTRLATLQADMLSRMAALGFAGWTAAFRLARDGETVHERLLFAEDQAARVADAMRATLKDLKETAPPPPLPE